MLIDDAALVRGPRWLVHAHLAHPDGWPRWWPRAAVLARGDEPHGVRHLRLTLDRPWRPDHHLRVAVRPWGARPARGVRLDVAGDVVAAVEFWLEDDDGGTVVHHIAHVDPSCAEPARWRPLVRRALWALDERLVHEVRGAVLPPPHRSPRAAAPECHVSSGDTP